jgi:hypothetical protein
VLHNVILFFSHTTYTSIYNHDAGTISFHQAQIPSVAPFTIETFAVASDKLSIALPENTSLPNIKLPN